MCNDLEVFLRFHFLLPMHGREKLFLGQIFELEIFVDVNVLGFPESENYIFSGWFVCVSVISITQKQIMTETSNLIFYKYITCRCNLKFFVKIEQKLCVQGHTKEF